MIDAPQRNGYRQHRDRFPGNGDENGNGVKVPDAPATVSGEPSDHMPLGSKDPEKAVRTGVNPSARRHARPGSSSHGKGRHRRTGGTRKTQRSATGGRGV